MGNKTWNKTWKDKRIQQNEKEWHGQKIMKRKENTMQKNMKTIHRNNRKENKRKQDNERK